MLRGAVTVLGLGWFLVGCGSSVGAASSDGDDGGHVVVASGGAADDAAATPTGAGGEKSLVHGAGGATGSGEDAGPGAGGADDAGSGGRSVGGRGAGGANEDSGAPSSGGSKSETGGASGTGGAAAGGSMGSGGAPGAGGTGAGGATQCPDGTDADHNGFADACEKVLWSGSVQGEMHFTAGWSGALLTISTSPALGSCADGFTFPNAASASRHVTSTGTVLFTPSKESTLAKYLGCVAATASSQATTTYIEWDTDCGVADYPCNVVQKVPMNTDAAASVRGKTVLYVRRTVTEDKSAPPIQGGIAFIGKFELVGY